jgi:hypothetical protein
MSALLQKMYHEEGDWWRFLHSPQRYRFWKHSVCFGWGWARQQQREKQRESGCGEKASGEKACGAQDLLEVDEEGSKRKREGRRERVEDEAWVRRGEIIHKYIYIIE